MATMVNRLYDSLAKAEAVAKALVEGGALSTDVMVTTAADTAALGRLGVSARRAPAFLDAMAKGAVLVTGVAPMGSAVDFIDIMRAAGPLQVGGIDEGEAGSAYSPGAVFSEVLGIPPLGGAGDLFSRWIGWPTLSTPGPMMVQDLGSGSAPYKPVIPMEMLSGSGAPYKPLLGSPLTSSGGTYKPLIPFPALTDSRAPYKGFLGLPLLAGAKRYMYY
jgi:hypothetical protein